MFSDKETRIVEGSSLLAIAVSVIVAILAAGLAGFDAERCFNVLIQ